MADKKLIITSKKYRGDTSVVSVRLINGLVSRLDGISRETGRTRNEIIQLCLEYAVDNLQISREE